VVRENLRRSLSTNKPIIVGINLGKNKTTQDSASDYLKGLEAFSNCSFVDYFVINISSPNTPGLRSIQKKSELDHFLEKILNEKSKLKIDKPLLLKISPDLSKEERKDIVDVVMKPRKCKYKIDGLIVSNTTISRNFSLKSPNCKENGGLSGKPLKNISTQAIREIYSLTKGKIPIIGVGGVSDAIDAYEKLKAGASLIQLYTSLTYLGPALISTLVNDLSNLIR
jgi:dihydroorotate oxidase